jgi:transposase-like protein
MKKEQQLEAVLLRKKGVSVKEIAKRLQVAKSSVSLWVRDVTLTTAQLKALKDTMTSFEVVERRRVSRLHNEDIKRKAIMFQAGKEIKKISLRDLQIIGLCLYLGEGSKAQRGAAKIANSDPAVIKIMMRYFREVCLVPEKKFRGHIHTYSHLNVEEAEVYWSRVSGIPRNQFYKTYSKPSIASQGKKDSTPYGTLDLTICSTELYLQIMGQIEKIKTILL